MKAEDTGRRGGKIPALNLYRVSAKEEVLT